MPKLKTHKATAKRFKLTGSGKLMRTKVRNGTCGASVQRAKRSAWKMLEVETPGENQRTALAAVHFSTRVSTKRCGADRVSRRQLLVEESIAQSKQASLPAAP